MGRPRPMAGEVREALRKFIHHYMIYNRMRFWLEHQNEDLRRVDGEIFRKMQQIRETADQKRIMTLRRRTGLRYVRPIAEYQRYLSPNLSARSKRQLPPAGVTVPPGAPPKSSA